ncbi:type 1 glutamine amidotransferase [Anaerocellum diazotrophicum]|uniref:Lipid II isoglutaminyl synthase (glutamine-hydrolyzing) subunit GatD n=1 Tax=Caldicellulosiruptor diazotrophicus TaxID=2806205 RepID=A0ABM7NL23_9FIRM|nr:glutamine amidotransferase [Caldicellulosiruptor diazotrophicus]BCS80791.1 glutamine amidotransferase [Caldicellulosiruptor diazotrophicus]
MEINIVNMFPEVLNLYGDRGNIICLQKRSVWRGIKANVFEYTLGANQEILKDADIILLGGASDREQSIVYSHLLSLRGLIKDLIEDGVVVLAICGGYQLLGEAYIDANGRVIKGLHLLDFVTKAEGKRLIGNIIIETSLDVFPKTVVGYENHGGRTYHNYQPFGKVLKGYGNNGKDGFEGLIYKNVIGTYLHGPLLPKNPHIADFMIKKALERKYTLDNLEFQKLDDTLEYLAHNRVKELYM